MPRKMSVDDLAVMIARGFDATATKADLAKLHAEVNQRFTKMEQRFDRVENILLRAQDNRLDRLEDDVRVIKTKVGVQ